MKLTKSQLKQIIKEELASQVNKINEAPISGVESRMQKITPAAAAALQQIGALLKTKSPQIKVDFLLSTLLPMVGITPEDAALLASKLGSEARKDVVEPAAPGNPAGAEEESP